MSLPVGSRLGAYEILSVLGAGGMGEVYRARDTTLNRDVAVKTLPAGFSGDPERLARFRREAQVLASLNHPHIAQIYGLEARVEQEGAPAFIVMELVEGQTLAERIARGALPVDEALAIVRQIADALEAAHEKGVIHRDLKPANIALTPDGHAKVLDFGLAKPGAGEASRAGEAGRVGEGPFTQLPTITTPAMTAAGMILGTAAYMSPEQAKGRVADKRSDIWAFGCVLYEMLTGKRAFEGEDVSDTLATVLKGDPDWSALPANLPPSVRRLLHRALEKDRRKRLADISDARLELDDRSADVPGAAVPGSSGLRTPRRWQVNYWTWLSVLATLASLAALAFAFRSRSTPGQQTLLARFSESVPVDSSLTLIGSGVSVSPSGQYLAVTVPREDRQILLRRLDGAEFSSLKGTEGVIGVPFWSPDSRFIAFVAEGKLKKIDVSGGAVQTVADLTGELGTMALRALAGVSGTWNIDGDILLGLGNQPTGTHLGVYHVSASGGMPKAETTLEASSSDLEHGFPCFLPDGRTYLFRVRSANSPSGTIFAGTLGQSSRTKLLDDVSNAVYVPPGYLVFGRQGALLAQKFDARALRLSGDPITLADDLQVSQTGRAVFAASQTGVLISEASSPTAESRLTWLGRDGKELGTVWEAGVFETLQLSRDDQRVGVGRAGPTGVVNIWVVDLVRGVATRLTFGTTRESNPAWSPNDSRIAFNSTRNGVKGLYDMSSTGGGEAQLLVGNESVSVDDRSRDDAYLLYHPDTGASAWAMPLARNDRRPVLVSKPSSGRVDQLNFSPDGKWVVYGSEESGRAEVYVTPFPPTGEKLTISSGGGVQPRWRGDGREVFYLSNEGAMMAADVRLGSPLEAGAAHVLFQTPLSPLFASEQFAVTQDGKRFLILKPTSNRLADTTFHVVVNWPALLR